MVISSDFFGYETLSICVLMVLYILLAVYMPHFGISFIHVTGVAMILGIGFGYIFYHVCSMQFSGPIDFDDKQFFYFILPPIVFAAGYNMKRKRFFANIAVIGLFGILGTLVCFVSSAACSIFYSHMGWVITTNGDTVDVTVKESLLISSVMGSSDTVAILSIVSEVDTPKMFSIIFGESIVNDAVSIIMYQAATEVNFDAITGAKIGEWLGEIVIQVVASTLLGTIFGLLTSAMTKWCSRLEGHAVFEIAFLFFMSMIAYVLALILGISGIITILITGVIMGHYAFYNLSMAARESSRVAFQTLGEMVEDFVFIYLGLTTWKYMFTSLSIYYTLGMVFSILLGRLLSCFILPLFWHVFKSFPLKPNELGMIWFGGSIRGCIAFGLILSVDTEHKDLLKAAILGMVVFTTVIHGAIMPAWGGIMNVRNSQIAAAAGFQAIPEEVRGPPIHKVHKGWRKFDDKYLRKWFIKDEAYEARVKEEEALRARYNLPPLHEDEKVPIQPSQ